jgi:hypothetical protein
MNVLEGALGSGGFGQRGRLVASMPVSFSAALFR